MLILRIAGVAAGEAPAPTRSDGSAATAATKPHAAVLSVAWEGVPLGEAIDRLQTVAGADILRDRRIDPNRRINLSLADADVEQIAARLAAAASVGQTRLERLIYIGPTPVAERLTALAALERRAVAKLPDDARQSLSERRRVVWPRLTEPRGLITQLLQEHGWQVAGGERIPYDLWAAGALPPLTLADQLTVLLAQFDLTYRARGDERTIEILPVNWQAIKPRVAHAARRQPTPPKAGARQVFTLRIENQPVGKVLDQLATRLGWKLTVDEQAIRAAGLSLDRLVSFRVENVDEDGLLFALLTPAGLKAERTGNRVNVMVREQKINR